MALEALQNVIKNNPGEPITNLTWSLFFARRANFTALLIRVDINTLSFACEFFIKCRHSSL